MSAFLQMTKVVDIQTSISLLTLIAYTSLQSSNLSIFIVDDLCELSIHGKKRNQQITKM